MNEEEEIIPMKGRFRKPNESEAKNPRDGMKDRQKWLELFVENSMFNNVKACIDGKANFAAALVLSVYTEVLGGLINGSLTLKDKSFANYTTFLRRMKYTNEQAISYYGTVRCGLAHQYFIKGEHTISPYSVLAGPRGIHEQNGVVYFFFETYFNEFKAAYHEYKDELLRGLGNLQEMFDRALEGETLPFGVKSILDPSIPSTAWPPIGMLSGAPVVFVPSLVQNETERPKLNNEEHQS